MPVKRYNEKFSLLSVHHPVGHIIHFHKTLLYRLPENIIYKIMTGVSRFQFWVNTVIVLISPEVCIKVNQACHHPGWPGGN